MLLAYKSLYHILTKTSNLAIKRKMSLNSIFSVAFYAIFLVVFYYICNILPVRLFYIPSLFLSLFRFFVGHELFFFSLLAMPVNWTQYPRWRGLFNNCKFRLQIAKDFYCGNLFKHSNINLILVPCFLSLINWLNYSSVRNLKISNLFSVKSNFTFLVNYIYLIFIHFLLLKLNGNIELKSSV